MNEDRNELQQSIAYLRAYLAELAKSFLDVAFAEFFNILNINLMLVSREILFNTNSVPVYRDVLV